MIFEYHIIGRVVSVPEPRVSPSQTPQVMNKAHLRWADLPQRNKSPSAPLV